MTKVNFIKRIVATLVVTTIATSGLLLMTTASSPKIDKLFFIENQTEEPLSVEIAIAATGEIVDATHVEPGRNAQSMLLVHRRGDPKRRLYFPQDYDMRSIAVSGQVKLVVSPDESERLAQARNVRLTIDERGIHVTGDLQERN